MEFRVKEFARLTGLPLKTINERLATLPRTPSLEQIAAAFVGTALPTTKAPRGSDEELLSTLALADMIGSYPLAIKNALKGITPEVNKPKLKQYRLSQTNAEGKTVRELLDTIEDPKLLEAKTRLTLADAELREIKVKAARRELVPYDEVRDELTRVIHHLYHLTVIKQPRDLAGQLVLCKSPRLAAALLKRETAAAFHDLRDNYKRIFGGP